MHSETMANREELGIIRGARAGDAAAQLALGKLYLFGGAGLPVSLPTALHWLNRAALQQQDEAWMLIGSHVPFEHAQHCLSAVLPWYERAHRAGVAQAGAVLARVPAWTTPAPSELPPPMLAPACAARARRGPPRQAPLRMADTGIAAAHYAMLDAAWQNDRDGFLGRALPLLRPLLARAPIDAESARQSDWPLGQQLLTLLARCATLVDGHAASNAAVHADAQQQATLRQCRELAAHGGERQAQLALGLWFARMDRAGKRQPHGVGAVNFKRAIRWLTLAGEQGLADAWS